ncbi:hypothetical protein NBRC3257_2117 [Gluconobacter thailandicus NBRC 3257]|uniref:Uncharacterized protein n=1 Tax=Gluconobacter thailandicus NBRC 3257 TaxID=1381097 RepID=A0ABQ0IY30_GLUTH|nr:hypothetical protein B932_0239 [Gluconobacter oxydans H24]GAC87278.1 hypothetical protein NBRC3255_0939 [Gluconobacter thailandicus NBRC 3255]GAD27119.1 hypothetical protein NBRC3257_2117 [Gluconobacter thailandicus NBRC 3257]
MENEERSVSETARKKLLICSEPFFGTTSPFQFVPRRRA